jgi:hypothetical protein
VDWQKQIRLRNRIKAGDDEAATRNTAQAAPVRNWWLIQEEQQRVAETERLERERRISDEHQARIQAQAQAMQDAQWAHGVRARELRATVVELQQLLAGAETRMNSAELDEAVRAVGEREVYRARLQAAEQAYAQHCQRSPL